jgi:hypothetical protein
LSEYTAVQHTNTIPDAHIMSLLSFALPAETALFDVPFLLSTAIAAVRPLLGLGATAALAMYFKPLLSGILRAALLLIKPRKSFEQRVAQNQIIGRKLARRMANDQAGSQPNLAAELRGLAGSD